MYGLNITARLLAFLLFVGIYTAKGQVSSYIFSSTQGQYQTLSGGNLLNSDDYISGNYYNLSLPFDFIFNGTRFSEIYISENGYVSLGYTPGYISKIISNANGSYWAIAAFSGTLKGQPGAELRAGWTGTTGDRIFRVQWSKLRTSLNSNNENLNFQINLYERNYEVEVVYGTMSTPYAISGEVGLRGGNSRDYANRTTTNDWTASIAGSDNTATCPLSTTVFPPSGLSYRWRPVQCPGKPNAGIATAARTSVCTGTGTTINLTNYPFAAAFQWQQSADSITWTNIPGATTISYSTDPLSASRFYRCRATCAVSPADSAHSTAVKVSVGTPLTQVATLPYTESFEGPWLFGCYEGQFPAANWRNEPRFGDASWRRNDQGSTAGWYSAAAGMFSPAASKGAYAARFHAYSLSSPNAGEMDAYLDFSTPGEKRISFDHINPSGTDSLTVLLSTNHGSSWTRLAGYRGTYASWQNFTLSTTATADTAILRFRGRRNGSSAVTDIGLDNLIVYYPCNGAPTPLAIVAAADSLCPDSTARLSLANPYPEPDITYQWQSRLTGSNNAFANIPGATGTSVQVPQPTATDYRCIIKCMSTGDSSFTLVKTIHESLPTQCYCAPSYTNPCTNSFQVLRVYGDDTLLYGGNNCTQYPGYFFYTGDTVSLSQGGSYNLLSYLGGNSNNTNLRIRVWVDFDDNGMFDPYDTTGWSDYIRTSDYTYTQLNIPASAATGPHRMRVKLYYDNTSYVPSCASSQRGYTLDAMAVITPCVRQPSISWVLDTLSYCQYNTAYRYPIQAQYIDSFFITEAGSTTVVKAGKYDGSDTITYYMLSPGKSYEITGLSLSRCGGRSAVSNRMYVREYPAPTLPPMSDMVVCKKDSALLTPTTNGTSFLWTAYDTRVYPRKVDTFYTKSIYIKPNYSYTLSVSDARGCHTLPSTQTIDVYEAAKPVINAISVQTAFGNNPYGNRFDFSYTPGWNAQITHVRWQSGDGAVYTTPAATHTYTSNGRYRVRFTAFNMSCDSASIEDEAYVYLLDGGGSTGIETNVPAQQHTVYPNPARQTLWISGAGASWKQGIITDLSGRILLTIIPEDGIQPTGIPVTALPRGMYLLQLITDNGREVHPFRVD